MRLQTHSAGFCLKHVLYLYFVMFITLPLLAADPRDRNDRNSSRNDVGRSVISAPSSVNRSSHGSVRHSETHVVRPPVQVQRTPEHHVEIHQDNRNRHDNGRSGAISRREISPRENVIRRNVYLHPDVDADVHRRHTWNNFVFGRRSPRLPVGFLRLRIGGEPFFYNEGIYYQPFNGGYQEVYPPVGAVIPQPPPGSIPIYAGGQTYYYAGGGFYLPQPDGSFVLAPTPIGVIVPELPPGAVQVSIQGMIAYQFNGIYYQPVFVNGVTQYQTFLP